MIDNHELLKTYYKSKQYFTFYSKLGYFTNTQKEVEFVIKKTRLKQASEILDLGCGQGRHAIGFAKKGFAVTAIDFSDFLIEQAKLEAKKQKAEIDFKHADMRSMLYFNKFGLVISLFSSFGLFSRADNHRLLVKIFDSLCSDGYFVLDVDNIYKLLEHLEQTNGIDRVENGGDIFMETLDFDDDTNVLKWTETHGQQCFSGYYQYYRPTELKSILETIGFKILNCYGFFNGEKFDKSSNRLIFICQKK